jgi:predicted transcriptional regulator
MVMSKVMQQAKNTVMNRPTLAFMEQQGLIIRTTNGAGARVWTLTEKGEAFLEAELD